MWPGAVGGGGGWGQGCGRRKELSTWVKSFAPPISGPLHFYQGFSFEFSCQAISPFALPQRPGAHKPVGCHGSKAMGDFQPGGYQASTPTSSLVETRISGRVSGRLALTAASLMQDMARCEPSSNSSTALFQCSVAMLLQIIRPLSGGVGGWPRVTGTMGLRPPQRGAGEAKNPNVMPGLRGRSGCTGRAESNERHCS